MTGSIRGESRTKSQVVAWVNRASSDKSERITSLDYVIEHGGSPIGVSTLGPNGQLVSRGTLRPDEGEASHTVSELLSYAKKLLKLKSSDLKRPNFYINDD